MNTFRNCLIAVTLLLGMAACTKEKPQELGENGEIQKKLIEVTIDLSVEKFQSPAAGQGTRSVEMNQYGQRIIASEKTDVMLVELVEDTDTTPETRAGDPLTIKELVIAHFSVLQYNGTGDDALLIKKDDYSPYTDGIKLKLYDGTNQRVVVIANDEYNIAKSQNVNTSTYADLLTQTISVSDAAFAVTSGISAGFLYSAFLQMSGTATGDLTEGGSINIPVKQNTAKVIFNVKTATTDLNTGTWKFQVCNVPNVSYYIPHRNEAVFPASVTPTSYGLETITLNNSTFTQCLYGDLMYTAGNSRIIDNILYLPANQRGTVTGTTGKQRKTNAPDGATYMKLIRNAADGTVSIYTIHLGANFTDDYNLKPNGKYTYNVTLFTDPDATDSRVVECIDYTDNGSPLFGMAKTNALHPTTGVATMNWFVATGTVDATLNPTGVKACPDGWRMPTQQELMLLWIYNPELGAAPASGYFWSGTEYSSNPSNAWRVYFSTGATGSGDKGSSLYVRCVRDL